MQKLKMLHFTDVISRRFIILSIMFFHDNLEKYVFFLEIGKDVFLR